MNLKKTPLGKLWFGVIKEYQVKDRHAQKCVFCGTEAECEEYIEYLRNLEKKEIEK